MKTALEAAREALEEKRRAAHSWGLHAEQRQWEAALSAIDAALAESGETPRRVRHKKRGTTYEVIGEARVQASDMVVEDDVLTVYRGEDGMLWCRPKYEFEDGRFLNVVQEDDCGENHG